MTQPDRDVRVPLMIGAIGHRDLVQSEIPGLSERVREFLETLQRKYAHLRVTVLTSVADGADRLVADAAASLGMPITYVLPMPSDLYEHDFDPESLREYRRILSVSHVLTLPLLNANTPDDVTHPGPARDMQYAQLGAFIAAHSHILLALWDGNEDGPSGGTAAIIRFHQDDYMSGLTDGEPQSRLDVTDDESDLVYHIVCSRDRSDGGPLPPLRVGEAWWLSRNDLAPRTAQMPTRYEIVLKRMVDFSRDRLTHEASIQRAPNGLLPNHPGLEVGEGDRAIAEMFAVADWLSIHYRNLTLTALRVLHGFAAAAGVCFIGFSDLQDQGQMIYPYLAFMGVSVGSYLYARNGAWQRRYVDYRVLAEALRVQFYWAIAGVERPAASRFSHDAFLKRQDLEIGWIRNVLRVSGQLDDALAHSPTDAGIDVATREWIGDEQRGQLHYYSRTWPRLLKLHRITESLGSASLASGLILAGWLALSQLLFDRQPSNFMIAMMGLLPLAAGVRKSYSLLKGEGELISQYQFMERILAHARRQLQRAQTAAERRRILRQLGDAALQENSQWILRQRERPISTVG